MATKETLEQTISSLVSGLERPSSSKNWFTLYWFSWLSCLSVMSLLTYLAAAVFPADIHLPQDLRNVSFWGQAVLWFSLALCSSVISFKSGYPGRSIQKPLKLSYVLASVLTVWILIQESPQAMASDFMTEVELHRGPCGFFIFFTGLFSTLGLFLILRKAAPTNLSFTALWTALSVGSISSMFMHLVCTHESAAHVLLWHVTPVLMLMALATTVSPRLLRW
jgi:hypothetical protein